MSGLNTKHNGYSLSVRGLFNACPKSVLAAIAVSYASAGGDNLKQAEKVLAYERLVLYENGIVLQKPPAWVRELAEARREEERGAR